HRPAPTAPAPRPRFAASESRSVRPAAHATSGVRAAVTTAPANRCTNRAVVRSNLRHVFSTGLPRVSRNTIMAETSAIAALADNYIWAQRAPAGPAPGAVAIVDPGAAAPVQQWLQQTGAHLGAVIITHHHGDHTDGIDALLAAARGAGQPPVPVYGPAAERARIAQITQPLAAGDTLSLDWLDVQLQVLAVPGHTLGHIALYGGGMLFAGDTLFRGG